MSGHEKSSTISLLFYNFESKENPDGVSRSSHSISSCVGIDICGKATLS